MQCTKCVDVPVSCGSDSAARSLKPRRDGNQPSVGAAAPLLPIDRLLKSNKSLYGAALAATQGASSEEMNSVAKGV